MKSKIRKIAQQIVFCLVWHLGGPRRVQNNAMGRGSNLLTFVSDFKVWGTSYILLENTIMPGRGYFWYV